MGHIDLSYELKDRYKAGRERVFLTGTQAIVRIMLMQAEMDKRDGLNTAGFVSGYRGSPLGGVDQEMWRGSKLLEAAKVKFLPAINEELGATAVLGSQQVETDPDRDVDGVYAMWYGKGPGVDRAADALKHGNAYGSSPKGGVLVVAGDDHGCVSSSMAHQSDVALMDWFMPILNPASVAEFEEFGLYGYALSRYSGMWVGFKAISETVESAQSCEVKPLPTFTIPADFEMPELGVHYRWPDLPGPQIENRMVAKKGAVLAFARANPIDRIILNPKAARFGIVTTGKGHLDLMEALERLGLDEARLTELGVGIYKVGMVWPLELAGMCEFLEGKEEILVVEEKRGIIESQIKEYIFSHEGAPECRVYGKENADGSELLPWVGELSPLMVMKAVSKQLGKMFSASFDTIIAEASSKPTKAAPITDISRMPYFCSGCPHNRSTVVPEGSKALAGIGCHFMASWMDRKTESLIQMGGEGVNWVGRSLFNGGKHIFQNLGEGTYFHSGYLAIRQAQAANTNITYKILFNDAVAMTGGQPVDGQITVPAIVNQVRAEGVSWIRVVSDEPEKYNTVTLPSGVSVHHRDELDVLQRECRDIKGVTVLVYDQTCAAEKRRRRKKGQFPDPAKRAFINHAVCEGCGDCSVQSNCLSIQPKETMAGRKRQIDQHSCNKDYSCVNGFCPSFVTVEGGMLRKPQALEIDGFKDAVSGLTAPDTTLARAYNLLIGGVGGTGVVTIGAVITMAAHIEGKGSSVLDFMGFAQKGGTVLSYVRLANKPSELHQVRIEEGSADAVVGCDMVVATGPQAMKTLADGKTRISLNLEEIPTGNFTTNRDALMRADKRVALLEAVAGKDNFNAINASKIAIDLLGDSVFSNMLMAGYAWQQGLIPVSLEAMMRAIELNGVAIEKNQAAFHWGRLVFAKPEFVFSNIETPSAPMKPDYAGLKAFHAAFLTKYQNAAYAERYNSFMAAVEQADTTLLGAPKLLSETVARAYYKLLAIKDEYEVARLYTDGSFEADLKKTFEGDYKVKYHMAPPIFGAKKGPNGRPKKYQFGPWMKLALRVMRQFRFLRGTAFDVFGMTEERRSQRAMITAYEKLVSDVLASINADNYATAVTVLAKVMDVRGYGPVFDESLIKYNQELPALIDGYRNPEVNTKAA